MPSSFKAIQNEVDLMLFEEGSFAPINWLLRNGMLDYVDYLSWRRGEIAYIEDHFNSSFEEIVADLEWVKLYATQLKLEAHCEPLLSFHQQPISFCRSRGFEEIFCTLYRPARNRGQRDLLFDSAPAFTVKNLVAAIVDGRSEAISRFMARLHDLAPKKHRIFESLLSQQEQYLACGDSGTKIEFLLHALTPSAVELLGHRAHEYLLSSWQALCVEMVGKPFVAACPENHLSFTAFKAFQWSDVIESVEQESGWNLHADLLFRHAEADFRLQREASGLQLWFRLFLLFPERAETLVHETSNRLFLSDWRKFNELEPELETNCFPAWVTLERPALAKLTLEIHESNIGIDCLDLIRALFALGDEHIGPKTIELRSRLRQCNPNLFAHYLEAFRNPV